MKTHTLFMESGKHRKKNDNSYKREHGRVSKNRNSQSMQSESEGRIFFH